MVSRRTGFSCCGRSGRLCSVSDSAAPTKSQRACRKRKHTIISLSLLLALYLPVLRTLALVGLATGGAAEGLGFFGSGYVLFPLSLDGISQKYSRIDLFSDILAVGTQYDASPLSAWAGDCVPDTQKAYWVGCSLWHQHLGHCRAL